MVRHFRTFWNPICFEKPQYSGYESAENIVMSYQRAYGTVDKMMDKFPWFHRCVKAATFTEIGESYDVKEFLENGLQLSLPSAPRPARNFTSIWERLRSVKITTLSDRTLGAELGRLSESSWNATDSSIPSIPGMESIAVMPIDKAMAVMEKLQQRYPWFKDSLLAASVTEVGERHDAPLYIKGFPWYHRSGSRPFSFEREGRISSVQKSVI